MVKAWAIRQLADLFFEKYKDYHAALVEYHSLLGLKLNDSEKSEIRLKIARCYFFLNKFYQTKVELEDLLKVKKLSGEEAFTAKMLLGQVHLSLKDLESATETFLQSLNLAKTKENRLKVLLNLAVCYEENANLQKAIETLVEIRSLHEIPETIDSRIAELKRRMDVMPGAKGLKR